jgi:hypothetical protein
MGERTLGFRMGRLARENASSYEGEQLNLVGAVC